MLLLECLDLKLLVSLPNAIDFLFHLYFAVNLVILSKTVPVSLNVVAHSRILIWEVEMTWGHLYVRWLVLNVYDVVAWTIIMVAQVWSSTWMKVRVMSLLFQLDQLRRSSQCASWCPTRVVQSPVYTCPFWVLLCKSILRGLPGFCHRRLSILCVHRYVVLVLHLLARTPGTPTSLCISSQFTVVE